MAVSFWEAQLEAGSPLTLEVPHAKHPVHSVSVAGSGASGAKAIHENRAMKKSTTPPAEEAVVQPSMLHGVTSSKLLHDQSAVLSRVTSSKLLLDELFHGLRSHIKRQVVEAAVSLARHIIVFGVGGGERAHGFTIIIGNSEDLFEEDEDGDGIIGESNLGEEQSFHNSPLSVFEPEIHHKRKLLAAFREDGAIVIDGESGEIKGMNYFVSDLRKGDKRGGARHKAASSVAQLGKGCYVIKASEGVTKHGFGNLQVFPCRKNHIDIPVKDSALTRWQKLEEAGNLLFEAGEYEMAHTVVDKLRNVEHLPKPQRARVLLTLAKTYHSLFSKSRNTDTPNLGAIENGRKAAIDSVSLWRDIDGHQREPSFINALLLDANLRVKAAEKDKDNGPKEAELAEKNVVEALRVSWTCFRHFGVTEVSEVANAWRVLGTVTRGRYLLDPAYTQGAKDGPQHGDDGQLALEATYQAILEFEKAGLHESDHWCVVSYWNIYSMLAKDRGKLDEGLPFLKFATHLYEKICGEDHCFVQMYKEQLANDIKDSSQGSTELSVPDTQKIRARLIAEKPVLKSWVHKNNLDYPLA